MKVYITPLCIDCRNFKAIHDNRDLNLDLFDITESTKNLKEYLMLRDTSEFFKDIRGQEKIGVPCFIEGDKLTFDVDEALSWIGQPPVLEEEIVEKGD